MKKPNPINFYYFLTLEGALLIFTVLLPLSYLLAYICRKMEG